MIRPAGGHSWRGIPGTWRGERDDHPYFSFGSGDFGAEDVPPRRGGGPESKEPAGEVAGALEGNGLQCDESARSERMMDCTHFASGPG